MHVACKNHPTTSEGHRARSDEEGVSCFNSILCFFLRMIVEVRHAAPELCQSHFRWYHLRSSFWRSILFSLVVG